jgi:hypothetical protein
MRPACDAALPKCAKYFSCQRELSNSFLIADVNNLPVVRSLWL